MGVKAIVVHASDLRTQRRQRRRRGDQRSFASDVVRRPVGTVIMDSARLVGHTVMMMKRGAPSNAPTVGRRASVVGVAFIRTGALMTWLFAHAVRRSVAARSALIVGKKIGLRDASVARLVCRRLLSVQYDTASSASGSVSVQK